MENRVTRLNEFSPIGACLLRGLFDITKIAQIFGLLFITLKVMKYFCKNNMGWGTFWAIFPKIIWSP
jgi:hypothetical protein